MKALGGAAEPEVAVFDRSKLWRSARAAMPAEAADSQNAAAKPAVEEAPKA